MDKSTIASISSSDKDDTLDIDDNNAYSVMDNRNMGHNMDNSPSFDDSMVDDIAFGLEEEWSQERRRIVADRFLVGRRYLLHFFLQLVLDADYR